MHGDIGAADAVELGLQALLRRVHQHLRALAEDQLLDLDKTVQVRLIDLLRVDLEDLALIEEDDLENGSSSVAGVSRHEDRDACRVDERLEAHPGGAPRGAVPVRGAKRESCSIFIMDDHD